MSASVVVANFLDKKEMREISAKLSSANIHSVSTELGYGQLRKIKLGGGDASNIYYQLTVKEEHVERALEMIADYRQKKKSSQQICPKCKSNAAVMPQVLNWWQRLYHIGTKPLYCKSCGTKWVC